MIHIDSGTMLGYEFVCKFHYDGYLGAYYKTFVFDRHELCFCALHIHRFYYAIVADELPVPIDMVKFPLK